MAELSDLNPFAEKLDKIFNQIVDEIQDEVSNGLGAFQDLIDIATSDDFGVVNDVVIVILDAATLAGQVTTDLLQEVFSGWAQVFGDADQALADLILRLHQRFSDKFEIFRQLMQALVATLTDFPKRFRDIANFLLNSSQELISAMNSVLLPLFTAGAAVFGFEVATDAIWMVLGDTGDVLAERVSASAFGLEGASLGVLAEIAIGAEALKLTVGTWLVVAILDVLRQAGEFASLFDGSPTGNPVIDGVLGPVSEAFGQASVAYLNDVEGFVEALAANLLEGAENDAELEWLLLQVARFTPVGLFLLVVATSIKLVTSPAPWLNLVLNPIEQDPSLSVIRLPRPTTTRKYVVFSDLHRDEKDAARPPYQFGSIDHFLPNQDTYLELLKHHAEAGYTIIEAGDCEELWFHRDFSVTPTEKMAQIVETNAEIYAIQRELHAQGLYFRVFGNHDSYLRDSDTFDVLRNVMEADGAPEFKIHDFIIIDGVKTMQDVPVFLGLDSHPNDARKPLIITHGHQWDFWNNDSNNILGKIIVSAVVTPLDMLDDPLRDIAGISSFGTPLLNFKQELGDLPVFNSWQSYEPAVVRLDKVQHMEDNERFFTDDIQYSETLAALMGMLIPVAPAPGDDCLLSLEGGCLMNLMSIGHTHNPHNMPYFDLGELPVAKELVNVLEALISSATLGMWEGNVGLVRSNYINTGISGWYNECFWALDLGDQSHGTGQPKLVNWTYNTRIDRPNLMDWELPHIPRDGGPTIGDIADKHVQRLFEAGLDLISNKIDGLKNSVALPVTALFEKAEKEWKPQNLAVDFKSGRQSINTLMLQIAFALLPQTQGSFTSTITLPTEIRRNLQQLLKQRIPGSGSSQRRKLVAAIAVLAVRHGAARNGLRGQDGGANAAAVSLLMLLVQLMEANNKNMRVKVDMKSSTILLEVEFTSDQQKIRDDPKTTRERKASARGLGIKVFAEETRTPLNGWTISLQEGGTRRNTVASARTNAKGRARLLGARLEESTIMGGTRKVKNPTLILSGPSGGSQRRSKPRTIRIALERLPARGEISIPLTRQQLTVLGLFNPTKVKEKDQRQKAACNRWLERFAKKERDIYVSDDLCLHDLILSTIGALDDPKTPFQKHAAKVVKKQMKDTGSLDKVARLAIKSKKQLKECLGSEYVECDGTGSLKNLAERLTGNDPRFSSMVKFFGNPTPNPLAEFTEAKQGLGLSRPATLNKECVERYNQGHLDPEIMDEMRTFMAEDEGVLLTPSINQITVWDPSFRGGHVVREADIHDKILTLNKVAHTGDTVEIVTQSVEMDVELSDPACLILKADGANRQIMTTDIRPGQVVTLWGSGFVSETAEIEIGFQTWNTNTDEGRLVPDDDILPAGGFSTLESLVHSNPSYINENAQATTYNGDTLRFMWPDGAGAPGLYRLRLKFDNNSAYPTSVTQGSDCSFTIDRSPVRTQEIYFVVLPAPQVSAVRSTIDEVECIDLTDPEQILGVVWPDDLMLVGSTTHVGLRLPDTPDGETTEDFLETFGEDLSFMMSEPGVFTSQLQLFPQAQLFGEIAPLETVISHFELLEIDGEFDRAVMKTILTVAIIVAALVVALIIGVVLAAALIAIAVLTYGVGLLTAGIIAGLIAAFGVIYVPFLTFIFGTAFAAITGVVDGIVAQINGQDAIISQTVRMDGISLLYDQSEVRYLRLMGQANADDASLVNFDESFQNSALGGTYRAEFRVETDD